MRVADINRITQSQNKNNIFAPLQNPVSEVVVVIFHDSHLFYYFASAVIHRLAVDLQTSYTILLHQSIIM